VNCALLVVVLVLVIVCCVRKNENYYGYLKTLGNKQTKFSGHPQIARQSSQIDTGSGFHTAAEANPNQGNFTRV